MKTATNHETRKGETMNATATRKSRVHLEAGLVVEMHNGDERHIICSPINGRIHHVEAGVGFGQAEITDENTFRRQLRRVVSRSTYDKR